MYSFTPARTEHLRFTQGLQSEDIAAVMIGTQGGHPALIDAGIEESLGLVEIGRLQADIGTERKIIQHNQSAFIFIITLAFIPPLNTHLFYWHRVKLSIALYSRFFRIFNNITYNFVIIPAPERV